MIFTIKITHGKKVGHASEIPFSVYWKTQKIRILKKWKKKKKMQEISSFYTCVPNSSWDTEWDNSFVILGHFLSFTPTQKTKVLKKWKTIWRCHHFKLVQQKTRSNDVYLLRYEVQQKIFVILGHFLLFYPTIDHGN